MTAGQERPPFEDGNTASMTHGAYTPAMIEQRAKQVHDELLTIAPWVSEDRYTPSVDRYLKAAAREALAHEALEAMEPGAKGFGRLVEAATAAARLAWQMGDQLGLTPAGHARLQVLVAGAARAEKSVADRLAIEAEYAARADAETDADGGDDRDG